MFMRPHSFGARVICAAGSRGCELQHTAVQTKDPQLLTLTRSEKKQMAQNCEIPSSMFLWICMKCNAFNMSFNSTCWKQSIYLFDLKWKTKNCQTPSMLPWVRLVLCLQYVSLNQYILRKKSWRLWSEMEGWELSNICHISAIKDWVLWLQNIIFYWTTREKYAHIFDPRWKA